ncbi:hypothetical protein [Pectobacterium quasiaquaticum]|uniref:hypothetical protein n=1 Tax=Pectobacterium quasiaquaticum TaxID=2774015 RepID=UPI001CF7E591|nr:MULTISPECIES: hypothetical protein [Pectobacterium]
MTANLNANSVITNGMKDGLSLMQTAEPGPQPVKLGDTILLAEKFPDANIQYPFTSGVVSLAYIPAGAKNITIDSLSADDDIQLFAWDGSADQQRNDVCHRGEFR